MVTSATVFAQVAEELELRQASGRLITERPISGAQGPRVRLADGREVVNLCSNDYLGLAADEAVLQVASDALRTHGFGFAAGRIICGTSHVHLALERELSDFLDMDDTLLFTSCFDANTGLFEALLGPQDVVISDALNHASIIDGIRLSKAARMTYPSRDLVALEQALAAADGARRRLVITDGVFSMDGGVADIEALCDLTERYDAMLVVDDSHGIGVIGPQGRGTTAAASVRGRVDLVTGTLGKALGGAGGGFVTGRGPLVELLRQSARPYVFSNALPPAQVEVARYAVRLLESTASPLDRLSANTVHLREALDARGLLVPTGEHPIVPIILGDPAVAREVATRLVDHGFLAVALTYPVVAPDAARIRLQVSASHTREELEAAADAVARVVHEVTG